jgi:AcrR family transcriptional regulator
VAENEARKQQILDAAKDLIIRHGYDKTTISDIADEVGLGRGLIYLLYKNKDEIFEALLLREFMKYGQTWLEHIEADQESSIISAIYRSVLYALNSNPFMTAIVKRDRHVFGSYLRKPGNIFESLQVSITTRAMIQTMHDAGVIRKDVSVAAMAHIMDLLSYGLVGITEVNSNQGTPPYDEVIETIAEMLERMLIPENGGDREAGKEIMRQIAHSARLHFEQLASNPETA